MENESPQKRQKRDEDDAERRGNMNSNYATATFILKNVWPNQMNDFMETLLRVMRGFLVYCRTWHSKNKYSSSDATIELWNKVPQQCKASLRASLKAFLPPNTLQVLNDGAGDRLWATEWAEKVKGEVKRTWEEVSEVQFTHIDLAAAEEDDGVVQRCNSNNTNFHKCFHLRFIINSVYHYLSVKERARDVAKCLHAGGLVIMANIRGFNFNVGLAFAHALQELSCMRVIYYSDKDKLSGQYHLVVVAQKIRDSGFFDAEGAILPEWKHSYAPRRGQAVWGVVYGIGDYPFDNRCYHGSVARALKNHKQAQRIRGREHYADLKKNVHSSPKLQQWFNSLPEETKENFNTFFDNHCHIEEIYHRKQGETDDTLLRLEMMIGEQDSIDKDKENLNLCQIAGMRMNHGTEEDFRLETGAYNIGRVDPPKNINSIKVQLGENPAISPVYVVEFEETVHCVLLRNPTLARFEALLHEYPELELASPAFERHLCDDIPHEFWGRVGAAADLSPEATSMLENAGLGLDPWAGSEDNVVQFIKAASMTLPIEDTIRLLLVPGNSYYIAT